MSAQPLFHHNVESLLKLAVDDSASSHDELFADLSDTFLNKRPVISATEAALMSSILQKLVGSIALDVRRQLAESLVKSEAPVPELLHLILHDKIDLADIVLQSSVVIPEEILVSVVRHESIAHQMRVAARPNITAEVSDVLVESGNVDVVTTLLQNQTAEIRAATRDYLIEKAQKIDSWQTPLALRQDLTEHQVRNLYAVVAEKVKKDIIQRHERRFPGIRQALQKSSVNAKIPAATQRQSNAGKLASTLSADGQLSAELLIKTLQTGQLELFEAFYAEMADLPVSKVRHLLLDESLQLFAISAKAIRLPTPDFLEIVRILRQNNPSGRGINLDGEKKITHYYESLNNRSAVAALSGWKRSGNNSQDAPPRSQPL